MIRASPCFRGGAPGQEPQSPAVVVAGSTSDARDAATMAAPMLLIVVCGPCDVARASCLTRGGPPCARPRSGRGGQKTLASMRADLASSATAVKMLCERKKEQEGSCSRVSPEESVVANGRAVKTLGPSPSPPHLPPQDPGVLDRGPGRNRHLRRDACGGGVSPDLERTRVRSINNYLTTRYTHLGSRQRAHRGTQRQRSPRAGRSRGAAR